MCESHLISDFSTKDRFKCTNCGEYNCENWISKMSADDKLTYKVFSKKMQQHFDSLFNKKD